MEGKIFEINVIFNKQITCQRFEKEEHGNLTPEKVKGTLLEDISELNPVNYRFLNLISGNSKILLAAKQQKLVTLQKCLAKGKREISLHLQSFEEKPS